MKRVSILLLAMVAFMTGCSTIANPTGTFSATNIPVNPSPDVTVAITFPPPTSAVNTNTTVTPITVVPPGAPRGNTAPDANSNISHPAQVPGSAIGSLPTATDGGGSSLTGNVPTSATTNATGNATQAASVDACTLLTSADIESVLGASITQQPATPAASGSGNTCIYTTSGTTPSSVTITVYISNAEISDVKKQMSSGQPVSGIGDHAAMVQDIFYVQSGNTYFSIAVVTGSSGKNAADVAKALAPQALTRLTGK